MTRVRGRTDAAGAALAPVLRELRADPLTRPVDRSLFAEIARGDHAGEWA